MAVETEFDLVISNEEAVRIESPGDLHDLLCKRLLEDPIRAAEPWTEPEIWRRLQVVISDQLGVRVDLVVPGLSFRRDLGLG